MMNPLLSAAQPASKGHRAALAPFIIALALLLALAGCSGEREPSEAEEYPAPSPLFYELANAQGEVEGWLLGTIHALPHRVKWRTADIDRAITEADLLLVEVARLDNSREISAIFARLSETEGLPPLAERIAPPLRDELSSMIKRSDHSAASLNRTEDWAAAIMLAQVDAPGLPQFGVDRAVIAAFEGRPVRGFETAEEQLRIFDALAPEDQTELLEGTVRGWAEARDNPSRLMRAWLTGDLAVLEEVSETGIMEDPELREALLVGRNERWLAELVSVLESDARPLVAVGAAHIVGPDGLPNMLEAKGYKVTRLD